MKIFAAAALAAGFAFAGTSFAGGYGQAGCGLGSVVFGSSKGFVQIFAATTNGTFGSQTLGITFGTSNCGGGLFGQVEQQKEFIANNMTTLSKEVAQGGGESVVALSRTYGCDASAYPTFVNTLRAHHGHIFASADSSIIHAKTNEIVAGNQILAEGCTKG